MEIYASPVLHRRVVLPAELLTRQSMGGGEFTFGGDMRLGDLSGAGRAEFLVYRCNASEDADARLTPCFMGAFDMGGRLLWQIGKGGLQPTRPGPVSLHDIDADGRTEVVCLFDRGDATGLSMRGVNVQIRDGASGRIKKEAHPAIFDSIEGSGPNWVHQRVVIANLRGNPTPRDFIIKIGELVVAFDDDLNVLWTYTIAWNEYSHCTSYIPAVGDIDGDGRDEVTGGYFLLDAQGRPLWEKKLGDNMDSVAIDSWDGGEKLAFCSGGGIVLDAAGRTVTELGMAVVPHGQEIRVARFLTGRADNQMVVRYNGHHTDTLLTDKQGGILARFDLNETRNNTGMETVLWGNAQQPTLLVNGDCLWTGEGRLVARLEGLRAPDVNHRMAWYHCIPADVCGDAREEVILYHPWEDAVYVYTQDDNTAPYGGYRPGPRQYNARLIA